MAKAHEPIKLTFLREGELSIDNSDTGGFTYLGIAYNKNKSRKESVKNEKQS